MPPPLAGFSATAQDWRIRAKVEVIICDDPRQAIQEYSRTAAMTFIGFESPEEDDEKAFFDRMESWVGDLPRVVLVDSIGGMSLDT